MLTDELDYAVGVDTHRDEHALVVVAPATGARLAGQTVRASPIGYREAVAFADRFPDGRRVWAVEGVGSYGAGADRIDLRDELRATGYTVASEWYASPIAAVRRSL